MKLHQHFMTRIIIFSIDLLTTSVQTNENGLKFGFTEWLASITIAFFFDFPFSNFHSYKKYYIKMYKTKYTL